MLSHSSLKSSPLLSLKVCHLNCRTNISQWNFLDPNDDAEVFGGPVRTNTDYESDYVPGGFGFPRVRVVVVPIGSPDYEDSQPSFPSSGTSFGNVFNILRSILSSG